VKGGVIPTQAFSKTPRSQFTVFSLQYAFELTLPQLGLLKVVTWPGSRFLEEKIFRLKIFIGAHPLRDVLQPKFS